MKKIVFMLTLLVAAVGAEAKYWRIGPSSVAGMDFASINAAMSSANVQKGDTLYLDQWYNGDEQTVTKQVVIIGTGYATSQTDEQVVAKVSTLNLKANKVMVKSVRLENVYFYNDDCTIDRCYVATTIQTKSTTAGKNNVYSSYIAGTLRGYGSSNYSQFDIQNCVFTYGSDGDVICWLTSSTINNNTIRDNYNYGNYYILRYFDNTVITNNIILRTASSYYTYTISGTGSTNTIEHNILSNTSALSGFPTNKIGYGGSSSELFTQMGNFSDYYRLAEKSAALGYATDGGEVGCHGGMFGCPSGGRPQYIPYFTKVTVGSRTEDGKLPVKVTIKIQDE